MTMTTPSRNFASAAAIPWMLELATRMLARSLNMPGVSWTNMAFVNAQGLS
jgi:hypothetical protein